MQLSSLTPCRATSSQGYFSYVTAKNVLNNLDILNIVIFGKERPPAVLSWLNSHCQCQWPPVPGLLSVLFASSTLTHSLNLSGSFFTKLETIGATKQVQLKQYRRQPSPSHQEGSVWSTVFHLAASWREAMDKWGPVYSFTQLLPGSNFSTQVTVPFHWKSNLCKGGGQGVPQDY